jgi:hypothetical protein
MPDVLGVSTIQVGDPMTLVVLVKAYDPSLHWGPGDEGLRRTRRRMSAASSGNRG